MYHRKTRECAHVAYTNYKSILTNCYTIVLDTFS